ncbi:leukocyte surface antigen CD53-like protein [Labeo rohita]|uniref:Leukocyte surface antigen CD53-like protein n=1 Tax=Labeo rohita TaxID=84645 RepID=A0A498MS02_LABRO|nr:leukocyte surface antigen CD53-like protein [Labeo rohita]RXN22144.1 leukocyte surface antigen CD53-like protein [Labeo rohita]
MNIANTLFITGIIITCVSFLGFLGALKENRCLLISFFVLLFILMLAELAAACLLLMYERQIETFISTDLKKGLETSIKTRKSHNYTIEDDWDKVQKTVLGMCFSMTLFCHISRSGLGYK